MISNINNNINDYQTPFSYEEDNCHFKKANDEYLLCYGSTSIIKWKRWNMKFEIIDTFLYINQRKITNITFDINYNFYFLFCSYNI